MFFDTTTTVLLLAETCWRRPQCWCWRYPCFHGLPDPGVGVVGLRRGFTHRGFPPPTANGLELKFAASLGVEHVSLGVSPEARWAERSGIEVSGIGPIGLIGAVDAELLTLSTL
jgi:hypothetical protein